VLIVLAIIGKWLLGLLGGILIYTSLLLRENEEGELQNRLEALWIRIDDLRSNAVSKEAAFLKAIADIITKGFNFIFGERLLSLKSIIISMFLSSISICFMLPILFGPLGLGVYLFPIAAILCIYTFTLCHKHIESATMAATELIFTTIVILYISFLIWKLYFGNLTDFNNNLFPTVGESKLTAKIWFDTMYVNTNNFEMRTFGTLLILALAIISDFTIITATRITHKIVANLNSWPKSIVILLANILMGFLLFFVPYHLSRTCNNVFIAAESDWLTLANGLDLFICSIFIFISLFVLVHRLVWPLIERPIYSIYRHKIFIQHKKMVFMTGVVLIGFAVPKVQDIVVKFIKTVI
jgi:hypothetical protein